MTRRGRLMPAGHCKTESGQQHEVVEWSKACCRQGQQLEANVGAFGRQTAACELAAVGSTRTAARVGNPNHNMPHTCGSLAAACMTCSIAVS